MSITVFLADDHRVVREGLKMLLETNQDIKVIGSADNGRDAIGRIEDLKPDIAIIDIAMPGLNGIEITAQVREKLATTRCIILSMHSTSEHIFRAFQAGAWGYVLKEAAGSEVIDAVRSVYSGNRYLCKKIADVVIDSHILKQESQMSEKSPLERLSAREREILQLVAEGKSSADIAAILLISQKTVETYRSRLMQKLGIHDIPSLVKFAIKHGIISEL
jgi:DNA-binding NarL/FixJ family response regulator